MVERKESQGLNEFDAEVKSVELEQGMNDTTQFHLTMDPKGGLTVQGKTGQLHEWVPLSKTSSQDSIAKGSVMDLFLRQVEIVLPDTKKASTIDEAFALMVGKTFHFQKMELGRAYQGQAARQYAVPVKLIE